MNKRLNSFVPSSFRVVLVFLFFSILGLVLISKVEVNLLPSQKFGALTISFSLPSSSPEIIERKITSLIEGACSQLSQIKRISSVSGYNSGSVYIEFDNSVDIEYKRLEIVGLIRQIRHQLPANLSFPKITKGLEDANGERPLLSYSINAPLQPFKIKQQCEEIFRKTFIDITEIRDFEITGDQAIQTTINFDNEKCIAWDIDPSQILRSVQTYLHDFYPGKIIISNSQEYFLHVLSPKASINMLENILIKNRLGNRLFYLKDIARVYFEVQEPQSYFRVNGKNSVILNIFSRNDANKIIAGEKIMEAVNEVAKTLPKSFELRKEYEDTDYLKREVDKNFERIGISGTILIIFVMLAYRSWRYLIVLISGFFASLSITFFFVWALSIDIHLYTIAALAISFGIVIDNAIVMLDYFHQFAKRKVFLSLMGATLTTIWSVSLIFFLSKASNQNLIDFAIVVILALISSLLVALFFTPALYALVYVGNKEKKNTSNQYSVFKIQLLHRIRMQHIYYLSISLLAKYRIAFVILLILCFGIPIFMLPSSWEGDRWYNKIYNQTIGSEKYQKSYKPVVDKVTGGALRLFVNSIVERGGYRNPEKTSLFIVAELPRGSTSIQLNNIMVGFENFIGSIAGVDRYITNISSGQHGSIVITFKDKYINTSLPNWVKNKLIEKSSLWGGVEWKIYGIGLGFSNLGDRDIPNFRFVLKGYNYKELERQAAFISNNLQLNKRVINVKTDDLVNFDENVSSQYVLYLKPELMALNNVSQEEIVNELEIMSKQTAPSSQILLDNYYYPLVIREKHSDEYSYFDLMNRPLYIDSLTMIKLTNVGNLNLESTSSVIHKENRQYIRIVSFQYKGFSQNGAEYTKSVINEFKKSLPVGFSIQEDVFAWGTEEAKNTIALVAALILGIFFICGILFENLKQAFYIICIIPLSFIGVFLIFPIGEFYFDQGGYAAFLILGGLVVNSGLFIINDFNNLRKNRHSELFNRFLIKSIVNRSRTIFLTTLSSSCGLVPFLWQGQEEVFWFSLAIGTIGGLIFSLFAVFIVLPVFVWKTSK